MLFDLDTNALTAGTIYRGQLEARYAGLLDFAQANPNVTLVIDEIHRLFSQSPGESDNLAQFLKPPLARGQITVIGITTTEEWLAGPGKDKAFARRFTQVNLQPLSREATAQILAGFLEKDGCPVSEELLQALVKSAERLPGVVLPDAAISLYNEIVRHQSRAAPLSQGMEDVLNLLSEEVRLLERRELDKAQQLIQRYKAIRSIPSGVGITHQDIQAAVARLTGIPTAEEIARLIADLEPRMQKRAVGQRYAIQAIAAALKRSAPGLREGKRPIGSFFFTGPTGVGKTEVARAVAEEVFVGKMIRLDMSEFQDPNALNRLIGAPPGYVGHESGGELTRGVAQNPFSLVVFDEAEKAHPDVLKILLQICEEGELTDGSGRKFSFSNTVIILTSNAGAELLLNAEGGDEDAYQQLKAVITQYLMSLLSPELINRMDDVILFLPLAYEELVQIFQLLLAKYIHLLKERHGVSLTVSAAARDYFLRAGCDPHLGARPLRRVIEKELITPLSEGLLAGRYPPGSSLLVDLDGERGCRLAVL